MRTAGALLASLLVSGCTFSSPRDDDAPRGEPSLTLDDVFASRTWTGSPPSSPSWAPDSQRLAFRWAGPDGGQPQIWLLDADGSNPRQLTNGGAGRMLWLPDSSGLIYTSGSKVWRTDLDGKAIEVTGLRRPGDLAISPDGKTLSFRRGGDLWLTDLQGGETRKLTDVGKPPLSSVRAGRYRRNEAEIGSYIWGGPTYAWSPDSRSIAVHYVDRTKVRKVPFPNYLGDETNPNLVRRSYPGDPNESRRVGILDVATGTMRLLDLPDPTATRIAGFSWSKNGDLLIDCESDTAEDRSLHILAAGAEQPRLLWRDQRPSRVYTTCGSAWHPDGAHVIVLSDLADRYGLYALPLDGGPPRLLTDATYDVLGGPIVTEDGAIFYPANAPNPYESQICRTTLEGGPTQLTSRPGTFRGYPSPDGQQLALLHSDDTTPTELFLRTASGDVRAITDSTPDAFAARTLSKPRYVTFPSVHDDVTLHARIFEPVDLDRSRRHPVIFGPVYSNTVRNRWGGFYGLLQQMMVAQGYIVVQVDVRGSTGYGRTFREQFLGDFAGRDLGDLESAVAYMESLPYVDPDGIGIWGSSYGGTLTAYSLLKKPGLFDAGVACAAAVDPHFFGGDDVAIVRRPETAPATFQRGAAQYAANLEDPLLLIHGMQDQIVPFKTVVDLAEALMRANKDFDFAFAPLATHGWTSPPHYGRYLLGKLMAHFDRHLRN